MTEEFLYFIWQNQLYNKENFRTSDGEAIEVLSVGTRNYDSGPDFFNAKIKIGDTVWAGNVEIHIKSSDWYKHSHEKDKAYDSLILHIVNEIDKEVYNSKGNKIETAKLVFDKKYLENFNDLLNNQLWINCENHIKLIDKIYINSWLNTLLVERLETKNKAITQILEKNKNDWEETLYQLIARNFGLNTNSLPFELLAKSLPQKILAKHKNNLLQIEALLFGQTGFLDDDFIDDYYIALKKEYKILKQKYSLIPVENHLWKFLRIRPNNFPTIRISQFANLIYQSTNLFSKLIEAKDTAQVVYLLSVNASAYWNNHYRFGIQSEKSEIKAIGKSAIDVILINSIVPILFLYGKVRDNEYLCDLSLDFLNNIKAEKNNIISKWSEIGIKAENSFDSQALLQLKNAYCNKNECIKCLIGNKIILNNAKIN